MLPNDQRHAFDKFYKSARSSVKPEAARKRQR